MKNIITATTKTNQNIMKSFSTPVKSIFVTMMVAMQFLFSTNISAQVCGGSPSYATTTVSAVSGTGTYVFEIGGTSTADKMVVTGTTSGDNDITGATLSVCFASGYTPANGDEIKIWDGNTAFTGSFATSTSLSSGWSYVYGTGANDGDISLKYCVTTPGTISGPATVCLGSTSTLNIAGNSDPGTWSVINGTGTATINSSGELTGTAKGDVVVNYVVTAAGCITSTTTFAVAVKALPNNVSNGFSITGSPYCSSASAIVMNYNAFDTDYAGPHTLEFASGATAYTVTTANNAAAHTTTFATPVAGTYTFTLSKITDAFGCSIESGFGDATASLVVNPKPFGTVTGASNITVCAGQNASINIGLTNGTSYSGVFTITVASGAGTASSKTFTGITPSTAQNNVAVLIDASQLTNTSSNNVVYNVQWTSLTINATGCSSNGNPELTGNVLITVLPSPDIAISVEPTADVCPGSNINFSLYESSSVGGTYSWFARDASGTLLGSGINLALSNNSLSPSTIAPTLGISCPTTHTNPITFSFVPYGPNPSSCVGDTIKKMVNVRDVVAPVIATPNGTATVACLAAATAPMTVPTATNNCSGAPINGILDATTDTPDPLSCEGSREYKYKYTDPCGNIAYWTYTYTIEREPFADPIDGSSTVACIADTMNQTPPTVVDNCGNTLTPVRSANSGTYAGCEGTIIQNWSYTDCEGNTNDWSYTYTIERLPFTNPTDAGSTIACAALAVAPTLPTVVDNCGNTLTPGAPVVSTAPTCEGDITYTYVYTDCEGNTQDWVYTYTIEHLPFANPTDAGSTVACAALAVVPSLPTVVDNCGNTLTPGAPVVSTAPTCEGDITYTYVYTDCEGNTQDWVYTYTIEHLPFANPTDAGSTVACAALAVAPSLPTVVDNCGNTLTPTGPTVSTAPSCEGTITYTYLYTDCEGNTQDWVYTYTIERLPFANPTDSGSTVPCAALAVAPTLPTVVDNCGNTLTPSAPVVSANPACEGTKTYTYIYTDCEGNTQDWVYTYTIDYVTPPVVPANGTSTVACIDCSNIQNGFAGSFAPANWVLTNSKPNGNGTVNTSNAPSSITITSSNGSATTGGIYTDYTIIAPCSGVISFAWTFTTVDPPASFDPFGYKINGGTFIALTNPSIGNQSGTAKISVVKGQSFSLSVFTLDNIVGSSTTIPAGFIFTPFALPVVADACGANIIPSLASIDTIPNPISCEGTKTYTYNYTDCSGLSSSWSHTITIEREPFANPTDAGSTVACIADTMNQTPPTVVDNCGNTLTPVRGSNTGTYAGCEGTLVQNWLYTDCEGNTNDWTYTYTIERLPFVDPTDGSSTVACIADTIDQTPPTVVDNCGNTLTPVRGSNTGTYAGCEGTLVQNWLYTDCEGNTNDWTYTYTIERLPFVDPTDGSSTVACIADTIDQTPPTVVDNCGNTLTPVRGSNTGTYAGCEGTLVQNWLYTDCEGNTNDWTYTYTIERLPFVDPTDGSSTVACIADTMNQTPPTVVDNCGNTLTPVRGSNTGTYAGCEGTLVQNWLYTDCEGNTNDWTYTYTIERLPFVDPTDGSSTVACIADTIDQTPPTVVDNCGNTLTPVRGSNTGTYAGCEGTLVQNWLYTDCEGNTNDWTYTYTIERLPFVDPTDGSSTVACIADTIDQTPPTVVDNCGNTLTPVRGSNTGTYAGCEGTLVQNWLYTDCEGNTNDWTYTYTIERLPFVDPTDGSSTVACIADTIDQTPPTVVDNCGNTLTPVRGSNTGTYAGCEGTLVQNWLYTDCEGNTNDWTYTYTIERLPFVDPTDGSSTVACIADTIDQTPPTVVDNCGNTLTPVRGSNTGTYAGCEGTLVQNWLYTDCEGNTNDWTYTYTIERLPFVDPTDGSSTVACITDTIDQTPPTVVDNCGNTLTPVRGSNTGTYAGCEGTLVQNWLYTDCEGNTNDWTYTYTIERLPFVDPTDGSSTVACAALAVAPTLPTVVDNCGNTLSPTGPTISSPAPTCEGDITYTYMYTDCEGNTNDWVYTYTIERLPFADPTDAGSTVACVALAVAPTLPIVVDNCGNTLTATGPIVSTAPACEGSMTYTYLYTDCEGNTNDWVYTYTIDDTTAPTFSHASTNSLNVGSGINCTVPMPDYSSFINASDNCGGTITYNQLAPNQVGTDVIGYGGFRTIVIEATDCAGNKSTTSFQLFIIDTTKPVATCQPLTLNLNGSGMATLTAAAANNGSFDNCGPVTLTVSPTSFTCSNLGANTYTLTVKDPSNNITTCTNTVTIVDNQAPIITCPANVAVNTDAGVCSAIVNAINASATDNCSSSLVYSYALSGATTTTVSVVGQASGVTFNKGVTTVTYTVTDASNNSATCSFTVNVTDDEDPTFVLGAQPAINVNADNGVCTYASAQLTAPSTNDNCGVLSTIASPASLVLGANTVTWTVTDVNGNTNTTTQSVTVIDNQNPTIATNAPITVNTDLGVCTYASSQLTAPATSDNCSVASVVPTPATLVKGSNTVTWTVTDGSGNTATSTQVVTVVDNQAPIISACMAATTYAKGPNCTNTLTTYTNNVVATDNCSAITITQSPIAGTIIAASVTTLNVVFTVTDGSGNSSTCTTLFTFEDQTLPTIVNCPSSFTVTTGSGNTSCAQTASWTVPTTMDNCMPDLGLVTLTSSHNPGDVFPLGTTTVTYTATDISMNQSTCTFTVTVEDNTLPILTAEAAQDVNLDASCQITIPNVVDGSSATDQCPGTVVITQSPAAGALQALVHNGTYTVVVTATDVAGNSTSANVVLTAKDVTAPVLTAAANQDVNVGAGCVLTVPDVTGMASDNCTYTITQSPVASSTLTAVHNGTYSVTVTATDAAGNTATSIVVLTAKDITAPILTAAANQDVNVGAGCVLTVPNVTGMASDNCTYTITQSPTASSTLTAVHNGTYSVTVTATDAAGNTATSVVVLTAKDITAPVLTAAANQDVNVGAGCVLTVPDVTGMASDNCTYTITQSPAASSTLTAVHNGTYSVTVTAVDAAGNTATSVVVLTAKDITAPVLTAAADQDVNVGAGCVLTVPDVTGMASDNCTYTITQSPTANSTLAAVHNGTYSVTVTATDAAGNTATSIVVLTAKDVTAPVLTPGMNQDVAMAYGCVLTIPNVTGSATDNCAGTTIIQSPAATSTINAVHNGTYTVTVTATDLGGNTAVGTVIITAKDINAPALTAAADQDVNLDAGCSITVPNLTGTAVDDCAGSVTITQTPISGTVLSASHNGTYTVLVTATDIANNTAIQIVTLTAKDVTAPVLTAAANQNVNLDAGCSITVPDVTGTATDNCAGVTIVQSPAVASTISAVHNGTYSVTVTATDLAGLSTSTVVVLTAKDVTAPILTASANQDVNVDAGCELTVPDVTGSATDNCTVSIAQSPAAGSTISAVHNGTYTVVVTATDAAGNTATSNVVLTAKDVTAPSIATCPAAITNAVPNFSGCQATLASITLGAPISIDNCSIASTTNDAPTLFPVGTTTVTWTVTDAAGLTATCAQSVTVVNNLVATISGTATVGQNLATTSNISFAGTGGTAPYSFVYTNAAGTSTITTTGVNTVTTVPQSNAVVGTYSYTLNSMTDANGCPAALPIAPANTQVITVVTGLPDFTPTIDIDALTFAATGSANDFVVYMNEIKNFPNNGALRFRVVQPAMLDITFNTTSGTSNVSGGTPNNNSDWTITKAGNIITCQLKPTATISGFGSSIVGFTATRKAGIATNTTGNINVNIVNGTGGDSQNNNNATVTQTSAQ